MPEAATTTSAPKTQAPNATPTAANDAAATGGGLKGSLRNATSLAEQDALVSPDKAAQKPDLTLLADAFNARFKPVLGAAFGGALAAEALPTWFSPEQLSQLDAFSKSGLVPKSLFVSTPGTGKLTAQQKILMSSVILTEGKVAKPDEDASKAKKPVAGFCGHWARWVFSYSGVTPPDGAEHFNGPKDLDLVGPTGEIVFGGGKTDDKGEKGLRGPKANPDHPGQQLPVFAGDAVFAEGSLKEGDWLYLDNGNSVGHSVIFVRWVSGIQQGKTGARYRVAELFSQLNVDPKKGTTGGVSHRSNIGYPYSKAEGVLPVTAVHRVTADSSTPETGDQLVAIDAAKAAAENAKRFKKWRLLTGKTLSLDKLSSALLQRGAAAIEAVAKKSLAPKQRTLLDNVIKQHGSATLEDIAMVIALCQRVEALSVDFQARYTVDGILTPGSGEWKKIVGVSPWSLVEDEVPDYE